VLVLTRLLKAIMLMRRRRKRLGSLFTAMTARNIAGCLLSSGKRQTTISAVAPRAKSGKDSKTLARQGRLSVGREREWGSERKEGGSRREERG
jgi:hypothetical protein